MRVIQEPREEEEVRQDTGPDADPERVREQMEVRSESCVDHLCGCNCGC